MFNPFSTSRQNSNNLPLNNTGQTGRNSDSAEPINQNLNTIFGVSTSGIGLLGLQPQQKISNLNSNSIPRPMTSHNFSGILK